MKTFSPLPLLAALGVLTSLAGPALAAVDTSQWKCESCPFPKAGTTASVEAGAAYVSDDSNRHGDFTGLRRKGGYALLGGELRWRSDGGLYGGLEAADLGLGDRSLAASVGREGLFTLRLNYAELEHWLSDGAQTPFLGVGGGSLTLPAGYPQATTASMPLSTTLRPVDLGTKRRQLDAGVSIVAGTDWMVRLGLRHETKDGTQRAAASFFSTAAALPLTVDQVTDQVDLSTSYRSPKLQLTVGYLGSLFRNGQDSLTWSNPFNAVAGGTTGQLALAPDNEFHQVAASAGYEVMPWLRASGDIAWGRMTQNAAFLAATLNPALRVTLPAASLDGRVDTFNASGRLTATPIEPLRLTASYARDVRDNRTASAAYPAVATDIFLLDGTRTNQAFDLMQDRVRLAADYRMSSALKASAGYDYDRRSRTLQEVVNTRESTVWGRVGARPLAGVDLSLKLAHAERSHSTYGTATWISPPENPLLRKFNLADRRRDTLGARADVAVGDEITLGMSVDWSDDQYAHSPVGLTGGRSGAVGVDATMAVSDETQLHAFVQGERVRSRQVGSQTALQPDWSADTRDRFEVAGIGLKHLAMKGKLELTADATLARSRSDTELDVLSVGSTFPSMTTRRDGLRVQAVYKLQERLTLVGSLWYERYRSSDWHLDGVAPGTLYNLIAFGDPSPRYEVGVLRLALRYRF